MSKQDSNNRLTLRSAQTNATSPIPDQADKAIDRVIRNQNNSLIFSTSQMREVKTAIDEIDHQHALNLAENQVTQAANHRLHMIKLAGERHRTKIRDQHIQRSSDLASQQAAKSGEAIVSQVHSHSRMDNVIQSSGCSEEDKAQLKALADMIVKQGMEKTSMESQGQVRPSDS